MKISKGRGIQFFKHPFFEKQGVMASKIFNTSKKQVIKTLSFTKKKAGK